MISLDNFLAKTYNSLEWIQKTWSKLTLTIISLISEHSIKITRIMGSLMKIRNIYMKVRRRNKNFELDHIYNILI